MLRRLRTIQGRLATGLPKRRPKNRRGGRRMDGSFDLHEPATCAHGEGAAIERMPDRVDEMLLRRYDHLRKDDCGSHGKYVVSDKTAKITFSRILPKRPCAPSGLPSSSSIGRTTNLWPTCTMKVWRMGKV